MKVFSTKACILSLSITSTALLAAGAEPSKDRTLELNSEKSGKTHDDHQTVEPKNRYKDGTPFPFQGPPKKNQEERSQESKKP